MATDTLLVSFLSRESRSRISNHYFVFEPTQIKSATGNSGAFDAGSSDITKSIMLVMKSKQPSPRSAAEQLKVGTQIEREHTDDPKVAGKIVPAEACGARMERREQPRENPQNI